MTPQVHAKKLGARLGLDNLYIKNDSGKSRSFLHFHSNIGKGVALHLRWNLAARANAILLSGADKVGQ